MRRPIDPTSASQSAIRRLRRKLLSWFDRNRRDLPWRRDRDPYRIWVSEVMLQQTTVAAVVPYFERFLAAFPNLDALAAADEQDVLRLWAGLGYYRRAKNLHQAAQRLVAEHGAELPNDPAAWMELPGVGRYIAGAVLSQAFDRQMPIVEANSQRVLCRLFGQAGNTSREPVRSWLWTTAEEMVPRKRAGDFNQALMELGALICTPERPNCGACPLSHECNARRTDRQEKIPAKPRRRAPVEVRSVAVAVRKGARLLLAQRRSDARRWANFWEFPQCDCLGHETINEAAERLLASIGIVADMGCEIATVKHGVTHHRITVVCLEAEWQSGGFRSPDYAQAQWLRMNELADFPAGSAQRRLLQAAAERKRKLF